MEGDALAGNDYLGRQSLSGARQGLGRAEMGQERSFASLTLHSPSSASHWPNLAGSQGQGILGKVFLGFSPLKMQNRTAKVGKQS